MNQAAKKRLDNRPEKSDTRERRAAPEFLAEKNASPKAQMPQLATPAWWRMVDE